ncbi:unnamed protein product [Orchesella dallaii]|uniref:Arrestin-like N-terminal domain-containing protein n=1 Tax=Orchesella dallaii TaxID=48710 RepID=A0ABP1QHU0_9HEXA
MGAQIFLNFDNPSGTFHPGEVITGSVSLSTSSPTVVKGLTVAFYGEGNVFWTETITVRQPTSHRDHDDHHRHTPHHNSPHHADHHHHHQHPHHHAHHNHHDSSHHHQHHHIENHAPVTQIKEFKNQETYLNSIIGIPLCERESGSIVELPAGFSHQIPFAFQLPLNLPMSCELDSGSIKYFAEASITIKTSILVLTFDTTKSSKKSFQMRGSLDLTQIHGALLPVELEKQKQFGFLCCGSSGEFKMQLRLARTGFTAGENIMFRINYSNSTDVTFEKLKVKLVQEF